MNLDSISFVLAIAIALGFDTFAVGLAAGTSEPNKRACFRLCFHFGLFQFLMPLVGWALGRTVLPLIQDYDHWIAFSLLCLIALKMFKEGLTSTPEGEATKTVDMSRGWALVSLSFATSFDALGVGFSMGISDSRLFSPALIFGLTASVMTFIGIELGERISARIGRKAGLLGAVILFFIAIKLLEV